MSRTYRNTDKARSTWNRVTSNDKAVHLQLAEEFAAEADACDAVADSQHPDHDSTYNLREMAADHRANAEYFASLARRETFH